MSVRNWFRKARPPLRVFEGDCRRAIAIGIALGLFGYQALQSQAGPASVSGPVVVPTAVVESKRFEASLRAGGTLGATNFAVIRAPRMRGARDRGGGGGGGGGGGNSSLIIESLAEPGTMVQAGDVVAVFESKRTEDMLDTYSSSLAQTRRRSASRISSLLIDAANVDQDHRKALADADKSKLELRTAEVRSKIQAEILALQAQQDEALATQLTEEVRLSRIANTAEKRVFEIDIEKDERRLARTVQDMDKMRLRTPVSGLVVVETMFQRDGFSQGLGGRHRQSRLHLLADRGSLQDGCLRRHQPGRRTARGDRIASHNPSGCLS